MREGDQTSGAPGIFFPRENEGRFKGGADRYLSRDLADLVQTQGMEDGHSFFKPAWMRHGLRNRSYYEAAGLPCQLFAEPISQPETVCASSEG